MSAGPEAALSPARAQAQFNDKKVRFNDETPVQRRQFAGLPGLPEASLRNRFSSQSHRSRAHPMNSVALIVAAGKGERASPGGGNAVPKQYREVGGKALIAHAVDAFLAHPGIDAIYVVIGLGQEALLANALHGRAVAGVITGGATRQDSVKAGLDRIAQGGGAQQVLIHDAARPFLPAAVIDRLLAALEREAGVIPTLPVVDTLARAENVLGKNMLGETVDRSSLVRVQTPQAFAFDAIMTAHARWRGTAASDDAQMVRAAGLTVATVEGDPMLEKVTHTADFTAAEQRLTHALISRTGMGYDVHRLEAGIDLWLGGVQIPHDMGLSGHSDADVALHAVTDALLGAIGDGDIGTHFPPSDPQWKGAASHRFVEYTRDRIRARGGIIDHVDLTIICEAPKIGPYRSAMRNAIAAMLQVDEARISIKATTTERLGFTGRGEGIAAQAVATVRS
jgi:2-C-methyl-D-erythritol 4-phosphate cytidylyltransferase / 2-C-methyl-D-erythritol 2,4-cyclodiphosphate synthase